MRLVVRTVGRRIRFSRAQLDSVRQAPVVYFSSHAVSGSIPLLLQVDPRRTRVIHNFGTYMLAYPTYMHELLGRSHVVVANELEYAELRKSVGESDMSLFDAAPHLEWVYITRGSAGVRLLNRSRETRDVPPSGSVHIRTPVGVGDAFAAGIVFGEHIHATALDAARLGVRLAEASIASELSYPDPAAVRRAKSAM